MTIMIEEKLIPFTVYYPWATNFMKTRLLVSSARKSREYWQFGKHPWKQNWQKCTGQDIIYTEQGLVVMVIVI